MELPGIEAVQEEAVAPRAAPVGGSCDLACSRVVIGHRNASKNHPTFISDYDKALTKEQGRVRWHRSLASDLALKFYPVLSSFRLLGLPGWAVVAPEAGAERRSAAPDPGAGGRSRRTRTEFSIRAASVVVYRCTTAHQNTHLSMLLKRRDFADWGAIPRGVLGSVVLVRR
jgi:hypothetical protein